jgi:RNA polymerase sigma factor (sigma-70 family)
MSPVVNNKTFNRARSRQSTDQDLDLVRAIMSGSVESWHAFVDRYSGLVFSVLRQQLFVEDEDEIQNVYVDILEDLYENKLREYRGKASLATWLVLVTRGRAVDYLRKKRGRRQMPRGYEKLNEFDRRVFQLHFIEGLGFEAVVQTAGWDEVGCRAVDIAASIDRIITHVDRRYLKRLEYEADARRQGIKTGKLLEYLHRAEVEISGHETDRSPNHSFDDGEQRRKLAMLESLTRRLSAEERRLLALRFEEGLTARQISEKMSLGGQRKVYTAIDRVIRRLRAMFAVEGYDPRADSEDYSAEIRG